LGDRSDGNGPLLVGESIRARLRVIDRVAKGRWPVLVLGETGTGKELVARSIHHAGPGGPFVTIDCSALVGPLMESELFGHVKGAFTSAVGPKTGLLELANGGTAFFDEIGELPLEMQSKLLRALQEKEFRPVGATTTRRSDFHIVAATNRDLNKEVERGNFRRDLYFRLHVVTIKLAPLRERREDIAELAAHFLSKHGCSHRLNDDALEAMVQYEWPGNVRELENCIQQLVALNSGPNLQLGDLPSTVLNSHQARRWSGRDEPATVLDLDRRAVPRIPPASDPCPIVPLAEMERREILRALDFTRGDRGMAAHLLGIGRTTLYRKLKEYEAA
jgi:DNA-binding NtrC family response regulator